MVRKRSPGQPVLPVVRCPDQSLVGVVEGLRCHGATPGQRHETCVTLLEHGAGTGLPAFEAEQHVAGQGERQVGARGAGLALPVAVAGEGPGDGVLSVVQNRLAVDNDLYLAGHAANGPYEDVFGLVVGRRPPVGPGPVVRVVPRPDEKGVANDHPTGRRTPARFENHRPGR